MSDTPEMNLPKEDKSEKKKRRGIMVVVFMTLFLDLVGFGIVIPIQPFFAENFGASATLITLLGGSYSLMQFIFVPIWGRLSDRRGRRPIMLTSIAITAFGYVLFATAESIEVLFLARMVSGFGAANIATSQAVMADISPASERAKAMGIIGAAFGLGFVFGPAIGAFLGQISPQMPIWVAAGLSTLNLVAAYFLLPETLPKENRAVRERGVLRAFKRVSHHPNVRVLFFTTLILTLGFSLMEQVLGLFIEHTWVTADGLLTREQAFAEAAALTGMALVVIGVVMTLIQGKYIGALVKRFGEKRLLITGAIGNAAMVALIPLTVWTGYYGLIVICAFMGFFYAIWSPSLLALLSRAVGPDAQGSTMGLNQSFGSLGRVIGPAMAGVLYDMEMSLPFFVGAAIVSTTLFFLVRVTEPGVSEGDGLEQGA